MMGSPPKYSEPDEEQADSSLPLLGNPSRQEYSYPPAHGHPIQDDAAPSVVYFYHSMPPDTGRSERLMGKLFLSKEDTITMIQSAITSLAHVERSRIHFHTLVNPDAPIAEQKYARVLDEVWVEMVQGRPHTLKVTLEVRQEDLDKVKQDEKRHVLVVCCIALGCMFIVGIIAFLTSGKSSTKL